MQDPVRVKASQLTRKFSPRSIAWCTSSWVLVTKVLFWKDRWINGARVGELATLVLAQVKMQVVNRRLAKDGLILHNWTLDIRDELSTEGLV